MTDIGASIAVLMNNRKDIEVVVNQLGGIIGTLQVMPAILRIAETYASNQHPSDNSDRIVKVLYYNDETKERVASFQRAHGLDPDGIVGNETWSEVESLLKPA